MYSLAAALLCSFVCSVTALVGYNCGGPTLNVTSFSTIDPLECNPEDIQPTSEIKDIQLLQLGEYNDATVIQCRIEIDRTVYHCGMHSHVSIVHNGRQQYILTTTRDACRTLHATGAIAITPGAQITGVEVNTTSHYSLTLAGTVGPEGTCTGTTYADPYGTWSNVIVQAVIKISLRSYTASVKLATNQIILQSGQRCPLQHGSCLDSEEGYTFWDSMPTDYCHFNQYNVLYDGKATKITSPNDQGPTVFTVTSQETTFALTETQRTSTCGYTLIKTEHPKLFILEVQASGRFKSTSNVPVNNLDIFTYVNSKFVYVEKHIRTQITQLYRDIIEQKCALEKQVLRNALTLIHISPEEVAYTITKQPGYMAVASGEAVHIIQCIPVTCQVRKTESCYDELPVTYHNTSYFLTPKTHILTTVGTRRECNSLIPTMYKLQGSWYRLTPNLVETIPPQSIQPITKPTWKYIDPHNLATGGIYSAEDLNNLRNHIMFPIEKPSIITSIAQGATGRRFAQGSVQIANLLDEASLDKIARTTAEKLWTGFVTFGSFSAGVLGLYVAIRTIKVIINTILNGIALHAAYGWSLHLLVAVWSSLTHFCIFLKRRKEEDKNDPPMSIECGNVDSVHTSPSAPVSVTQPDSNSTSDETDPRDILLRKLYPDLNSDSPHTSSNLTERKM